MTGRCIAILLVVVLASCGKKNKIPPGILPPDKMQAVLWDVIRVDAFTSNYTRKDSSRNEKEENANLQQKVFAIHRVTKEDFYRSYSYYKTNTALMRDMVDTMLVRVQREKTRKQNLRPLTTE